LKATFRVLAATVRSSQEGQVRADLGHGKRARVALAVEEDELADAQQVQLLGAGAQVLGPRCRSRATTRTCSRNEPIVSMAAARPFSADLPRT
jgi:hypothetical protein